MAKSFLCSSGPTSRLMFGVSSSDLLSDELTNLNNKNLKNLENLGESSGLFKHPQLTECIFLMTQELRQDPLVGYCAIEILERFMVKHLEDLFTTPTPRGPPDQDLVFEKLKIVDNNTAVQFLHSMGHTVSKKTLMESELQILKGLDFNLNVPNPLTYVEILLEALGHNRPSTPVERLYHLCGHVLRVACLQRAAIYESLLQATTQCVSPSREQRERFLTVTEDCMLLAAGVITVAAAILDISKWEQAVQELCYITGISQRSIREFSQVMLEQITKNSST